MKIKIFNNFKFGKFGFLSLILAAAMVFSSCAQKTVTSEDGTVKHLITAQNPIVWDDIPDVDVIRVDNAYYMVSTTMYFMPGCPVMRSYDLVHWEILGYVYDILEDNNTYNLVGEDNAYAKGQWASSIRYNDGVFYVLFCSLDQGKTYIFHTDDIEKCEWERIELDRVFYDASLFFDDDGKVYVIGGVGGVTITELKPDLSGVQPGGIDQPLLNSGIVDGLDGAEGSHFYKINGTYYLLMISYATAEEGVARCELCYKCDELTGQYEGKKVLCDSMGYYGNGVAQGGIVDTPEGDWYALLFQDHGSVGRVPCLQPVEWKDGWPMMGKDGKAVKEVSVYSPETSWQESSFMADDEFDSEDLSLLWEWNHNPDDANWSLSERPGYMRIRTSAKVKDLFHARNILTQRTEGPVCSHTVKLDFSGLNPGDRAGITAFQAYEGEVGVKIGEDGKAYAYFATLNRGSELYSVREDEISGSEIYLRIDYNFSEIAEDGSISTKDQARFYYSLDGEKWEKIGKSFNMTYSLELFTGYRTGLYCYSTENPGGYADFDWIHVTKGLQGEK